MSAETPLLYIENLRVTVKSSGTELVRGVDLDVRSGEIVGVVGESGSGKSMTAMSILKLLPSAVALSGGRVVFDGVDLAAASERQLRSIRGRDIGVVFQDPLTALNPLHGVGKQVSEPLRLHGLASRRGQVEKAVEVLTHVGIPRSKERLDERPFQFSGGMRQRVLIAEALSAHPRLLIADEPTTGLDVTIQMQIIDLLDRMRREDQMSILLISHDIGMIAQICDRIVVMYAGRVVESGPTARVLTEPLHPYTRALIGSVPDIAREPGSLLPTIPGAPPAMTALGSGCAFAPRCPIAEPSCLARDPALMALGPDHSSACLVTQREGGLGVQSRQEPEPTQTEGRPA